LSSKYCGLLTPQLRNHFLFVILRPYCSGRKCYVCHVNPCNATASTCLASQRLSRRGVGRMKPESTRLSHLVEVISP